MLRLKDLVGKRCGIVRELHRAPRDLDDPPIVAFGGRLCDTSRFLPARAIAQCGGGGATEDEALGACLGEAAERYAAAYWNDIVWDTARGLGNEALLPETLFTDWQYASSGFPFTRPNASTLLPWVRMTHLTTRARRFVPAVFVYCPHPTGRGPEIAPSLSTGLASHTDTTTAIQRAICECIERDALALLWLRGIQRPRVEPSVPELLDSFEGKVIVGDMTTDLGVPSFYCLMEGEAAMGPVVSFGAACDPDAKAAVYRAVREACLGRVYVKSLRRQIMGAIKIVVDFADHARYFTDHPEHHEALRFLTEGPLGPLRGHAPLPQIDGYVLEITPPDILSLGLHVVRVWIPSLVPLHADERLPFLGAQRLYETDRIFPGSPALYGRRFNPWPHPMP